MDEFNAVNDAQVEVVEPQDTADVTSASVVDTTEETVEEQTQEVAKPAQTAEENSAFAKMRRENEELRREKAKAEQARLQAENAVTSLRQNAVKLGYGNDDADVDLAIESAVTGTPIEILQAERKAQSIAQEKDAEKQRLEAELKLYREKEAEHTFLQDLNAIKEFDKECKAETITELGEKFVALRANGIDVLTAYKATREAVKPAPPVIGKVNSVGTGENEYFTDEELNNLTDKELDNPKIYEKAMKSLKKIKK